MIQKNLPAKEEIVLDNLPALNVWANELRTFQIGTLRKKYRANLPEFSAAENQKISSLLAIYYSECGCKTGGFFMSAAFSAAVIRYFAFGGTLSAVGFPQIAWLALMTVVGAATGKGLALLYVRWKLIKLSDAIRERLHVRHSHQSVFAHR